MTEQDDTQAAFDKGPWHPHGSGTSLAVASEDFRHDVLLHISGDFATMAQRAGYAQKIARVLTLGCAIEHALAEMEDPDALLKSLKSAARAEHGAMLYRAAAEVAQLRGALADALEMLQKLQAPAYAQRQVEKTVAPSAFASALASALRDGPPAGTPDV
jgi:hypothetical protein